MLRDENEEGDSLGYKNGFSGGHTVIVPSVWNSEISMLEYEGVVWYEKEFYTEGGTLRFSFGSVMTEAKVYLDGELLGEHYGGFCKFSFTKCGVSEGYHKLIVRIDNRFDKYSIPHALVDWYHYGGITRGVEVHRLSGISILYSLLDYTLDSDRADCKIRITLYNAENAEKSDRVSFKLSGKEVASAEVTLSPYEEREISLPFTLDNVKRWSKEEPSLYTILTETATDDLYDKVGFRTLEVKDKKIFINGNELTVLGVNRHEDHPDFGMAFPEVLMLKDLEIIENMGCNTIRGSHYPNDPMFVDMMDERGMYFWSEIPLWGPEYTGELYEDEFFAKRAMDMHKEMVKEYYNHPSIVFWGILNENDTRDEGTRIFTENCYNYLKSEGGNRLVTFATNKINKDICLKNCDFISLNLYIGWYPYKDKGFETWENTLDTMDAYFKEVGVDDKPVIMSEFGAAAIYGHHTFDNLKGTEEYQAKLIADCLNLFLNRPGYSGTLVWQYCDTRTSAEQGLDRARRYNNKGIVNEYRRPKLAYGVIKEYYKKALNK